MPILHLDDTLSQAPFAGQTLAQHLKHLVPEGAHLDARWPTVSRERLDEMVREGGYIQVGDQIIASCNPQLGAVGLPIKRGPNDPIQATDAWTLCRASQRVIERRLRGHMSAGVHIVDPARTLVGPQVTLEAGSILWPDCTLLGKTHVSKGAQILSGCWLMDTTVGESAVIKPHSVCTKAQVGPGCNVGPMAHLRPGTVLLRDAKVGNFVEIKKTVMGEGAKASHLTYLGDTTVGPAANIGAGTITCNYDGFGKHSTYIGANAFIGSNSALVAPIRIGDGAIVGAGSTLTADVSDNDLAVERADARVLKGYAKRLNARNQVAAAKAKANKP
ncbi:MAG: hypothetical protein GWP91_14470 [Rhodobacterales bacterium]|nr:hypothetical protein [Rhodobacterales bacterium]